MCIIKCIIIENLSQHKKIGVRVAEKKQCKSIS